MTDEEKDSVAGSYEALDGNKFSDEMIAKGKPCATQNQVLEPSSAAGIAKSPDILDLFIGVVRRLGTVGDESAYKLLYLVLTSRVFDKIASLFVQGPSGAGKSFAIDQTIRFFPESAYFFTTGMSEKALAYIEESLKHRIIVIAESAGLTGHWLPYLVRSLISEGKIEWSTVDTNGGRDPLATRKIRVDGPCGIILTTTEARLHPEVETRGFKIQVDDAKAQTRRIIEASAEQAAGTSQKVDVSPVEIEAWVEFQKQLQGGSTDVIVPFAPRLAKLIPDIPVRLRRDFKMLLIFIRAHALLHRENRQKSPEGSIIATLEEDYEKVADLLREPISEAAGTSVPKNVRRVIQGVEELLKADPKGSIRSLDLAAHLGIDRGSCSRNVNQAIELGYLVNDRARGSKASELRLGKPIPDIMSILPRASDLTDSDWRIGTD